MTDTEVPLVDLRARLATEWLKHQHTGLGYCRCKHKPEHGLTPLEAFATHFADVLLSLDGIAIVDTEALRAQVRKSVTSRIGNTFGSGDEIADDIFYDIEDLAAANKTEEKR